MEETTNINELEQKYGGDAPSTEFASLLEQSESQMDHKEIAVGQRVPGKVQKIEGPSTFVDFGGRSEGVIDTQELRDRAGTIQYAVGDTIEAFVASMEGEVRLTMSLRGGSNTEVLREAYENGIPVEGRATGFNEGGLVVNLGGRRAFCPISQVDTAYCEDLTVYAGQTLTFKIMEFGGSGRNIVLSRRAHLEEEAAKRARELRDKLQEGAEVMGTVRRLERFGAFVDIGGVEGLVHVSELSFTRVEHPGDVLSVGEEIKVQILELKDLGGDKERISLSIKALQPDPWFEAADKLQEGQVLSGKVVSVQQFGAFVEVWPGVEGLVHVSQLSKERVNKPSDVVSVGQEVNVRIQKIDRELKRFSLSMRAAQEEAADSAEAQEIEAFRNQQESAKAEGGDQGPMADALRRAGLL
jgi:small subunit ribosomal protein S1